MDTTIEANDMICNSKLYIDFTQENFLHAFTREEIKKSLFHEIDINKTDILKAIADKTFASSMEEADNANEWYCKVLENITDDMQVLYHSEISFTELFLNAFEHGNLGIDSVTKNILLDNDTYYDFILEKEKDCSKKISVKVYTIEHVNATYIVTQITDEGNGFDTKILSDIFKDTRIFNGRGVFVSRKNSLGIYYNGKGNSVLYLNKV